MYRLGFCGFNIIEDERMVENALPRLVRRAWRDRLFTRPWRPWRKHKTVIDKVAMQCAYQFDEGLVMHPEIAAKVRAALASPPNA
jgi:hypothetical protein